jgi:hypothetical protein
VVERAERGGDHDRHPTAPIVSSALHSHAQRRTSLGFRGVWTIWVKLKTLSTDICPRPASLDRQSHGHGRLLIELKHKPRVERAWRVVRSHGRAQLWRPAMTGGNPQSIFDWLTTSHSSASYETEGKGADHYSVNMISMGLH